MFLVCGGRCVNVLLIPPFRSQDRKQLWLLSLARSGGGGVTFDHVLDVDPIRSQHGTQVSIVHSFHQELIWVVALEFIPCLVEESHEWTKLYQVGWHCGSSWWIHDGGTGQWLWTILASDGGSWSWGQLTIDWLQQDSLIYSVPPLLKT